MDQSPCHNFLATSDDFGKVNLFQYPAVKEGGSLHLSYSGHSSHVTSVRWIKPKSYTDSYLVSIGGEDKSVFQWKLTLAADGKRVSEVVSDDVIDIEDVEFDAPTGGDEFTAVKPWLGAIVPPTAWANASPKVGKADPFYTALGMNIIYIINSYNKYSGELGNIHWKLSKGADEFELNRNEVGSKDQCSIMFSYRLFIQSEGNPLA